ncbi:MAG: hypothetical protein Q9202_004498 [Teloschistes flavicans]
MSNATDTENSPGISIKEPRGFSCKIIPIVPPRLFNTKDLYSSTLHALLHYSLQDYESPAARFNTRGATFDPSTVMVHAIPRTLSMPRTLNKFMAWGLYYSVIAFNNPANTRELSANIFLYDRLVGSIEYRKVPRALSPAKGPAGNVTASMAQLLQNEDDQTAAKAANPGFSLRWMPVRGGAFIRRETAYDTIAYAILCTAPLPRETKLLYKDRVAVPGGQVYLGIDPGPPGGQWGTMTIETVARIFPQIPRFLEQDVAFREAAFEYVAPDGTYAGSVGMYVTGHTAADPSNLSDGNASSSNASNSTAARVETA